jgi:hypothetical protein
MSLTNAIFRNSVFFFALIPLFAIWGFWVTYFVRPSDALSPYDHIHGMAMFGWCLMLIVQSSLIRMNRRDIHRQIGKLSYVLAPLIIVSTLLLGNYRLNVRGLTDEGLYILSLQTFVLTQYVVFYAFAMKNRKQSDVHARYMVCTALPLLDPIFARILGINFFQADFTTGFIQYITFTFTDLVLVILIIWDWKSHQRRDVFLPMLFVLLVTQIPTFFVLKSPTWHAFAAWYMQLPLS